MTTATTWQWAIWENSLDLRIPSKLDLAIETTIPMLSKDEIVFLCDECHAPILLHPIPCVDDHILCPDCFKKHTGLLLNIAAVETRVVLREIKK
jgi:hypothetical protein